MYTVNFMLSGAFRTLRWTVKVRGDEKEARMATSYSISLTIFSKKAIANDRYHILRALNIPILLVFAGWKGRYWNYYCWKEDNSLCCLLLLLFWWFLSSSFSFCSRKYVLLLFRFCRVFVYFVFWWFSCVHLCFLSTFFPFSFVFGVFSFQTALPRLLFYL